jgi:beta-lactamase superfamily II metal-dependent hydrolase
MTKFLLYTVIALFTAISNSASIAVADTDELVVHFIDVGQGDSTLIVPPDGSTILVDTGSPVNGPLLINYLRMIAVNRINRMIFTHAHDDHIGGIFSVISSFKVDEFCDNGFSNFKSSLYGEYIKLVRGDLSKYRLLQAGEVIKSGDVEIAVLNPIMPPSGDLNDDSIVLKITFRDVSILLAGDIGVLGEKRLLNSGVDLKSNILKIGHHGDVNSGSDAFLDAVSPETVIISAGVDNKYAVPDLALIKRLRKRHVRIYRTDQNGNIFFKTDGRRYSISPERHQR